jgi:hypothetical protein
MPTTAIQHVRIREPARMVGADVDVDAARLLAEDSREDQILAFLRERAARVADRQRVAKPHEDRAKSIESLEHRRGPYPASTSGCVL